MCRYNSETPSSLRFWERKPEFSCWRFRTEKLPRFKEWDNGWSPPLTLNESKRPAVFSRGNPEHLLPNLYVMPIKMGKYSWNYNLFANWLRQVTLCYVRGGKLWIARQSRSIVPQCTQLQFAIISGIECAGILREKWKKW